MTPFKEVSGWDRPLGPWAQGPILVGDTVIRGMGVGACPQPPYPVLPYLQRGGVPDPIPPYPRSSLEIRYLGYPPLGGYPQNRGPKRGPKPHSYFIDSDGVCNDLALFGGSKRGSKWGPRPPILDPLLEGYPLRMGAVSSLIKGDLAHDPLRRGSQKGPILGSKTPYFGPLFIAPK